MSGDVKPLTKEEWDAMRSYIGVHDTPDLNEYATISATLDALFGYRERTRGMYDPDRRNVHRDADTIAADLGLE